jgi:hypothetical protein
MMARIQRPTLARVLDLVLIGLLIALFLAMAHDVSTGLPSTSVDFAHHYSLVHELVEFGSRTVERAYLGEMNYYPAGAHYLAAAGARFFGLSIFAAMGWVAFIGTLIISVSLAWFARSDEGAWGRGAGFGLFIVGMTALNLGGASLFSHLHPSFFYSQHIGEACSLAAMIIIYRTSLRLWLKVAAFCLLAVLIAYVHLLPALRMLVVAGALVAISFFHLSWRQRLFGLFSGIEASHPLEKALALGIVGMTAAGIAKLHPSYEAMRHISENNGVLTLNWPVVVMAGGFLPFAALCVLLSGRVASKADGKRLVLSAVLYLSSVVLVAIQGLLYLFLHQGSLYAVFKHSLGVSTFGLVLTLVIFAPGFLTIVQRCFRRSPTSGSISHGSKLGMLAVAILLVAVNFRFGGFENPDRLERAIRWFEAEGRAYESSAVAYDLQSHYINSYLFNLSYLKVSRANSTNASLLDIDRESVLAGLKSGWVREAELRHLVLFNRDDIEIVALKPLVGSR